MRVWANYQRGGINRYDLNVNGDDSFFLQSYKQFLQNTRPRPASAPLINAIPFAKLLRQPSPFAAVFHNVQNSIYKSNVINFYIPALNRQIRFYALVLLFRYFHTFILLYLCISVNTP